MLGVFTINIFRFITAKKHAWLGLEMSMCIALFYLVETLETKECKPIEETNPNNTAKDASYVIIPSYSLFLFIPYYISILSNWNRFSKYSLLLILNSRTIYFCFVIHSLESCNLRRSLGIKSAKIDRGVTAKIKFSVTWQVRR